MGNCQTVDAAALVIHHPNGKQQRMYWSISAAEVMRMNPGHYVSLIIPIVQSAGDNGPDDETRRSVNFTRVKLLRPTETLLLGQSYRLVTTQDVLRVIKAKKTASLEKTKKENQEGLQKTEKKTETKRVSRSARNQQRCCMGSSAGRHKSWRPSLQSISELGA